MPDDREALGRLVREVWVAYVRDTIPDPKPSWVAPWDELDGFQREVDMRIGEAVAAAVSGRAERAEAKLIVIRAECKGRSAPIFADILAIISSEGDSGV